MSKRVHARGMFTVYLVLVVAALVYVVVLGLLGR